MGSDDAAGDRLHGRTIVLVGARLAVGADKSFYGFVEIVGKRVVQIVTAVQPMHLSNWPADGIDLSGYLVLPGLINAHDHLEFSLYPNLADPPYRNYVEWGQDIHAKFADAIARQHAVPKEMRLWWGGIRNLLCGVTTVCHHNPFWPELQNPAFPIRVVSKYGWAHSVALGGDLHAARANLSDGQPFIVHACEGTDDFASYELHRLHELGMLNENTVLVHGLAINRDAAALVEEHRTALIICPSSNQFVYGRLPNLETLSSIQKIALGNDSPLTAKGDLLDEVRFAIDVCNLSPAQAYRMVTTLPASILQLEDGEGSLSELCVADLIAIRDNGQTPSAQLCNLSAMDVELVMIGGRVQLASGTLRERLPLHATQGLEPLAIGETVRWLRAPVRQLLDAAEAALGKDGVRLGGEKAAVPANEVSYAG
jgi:cytosine/adenosine deaminase-related metal-dependent hydrolase